MATSKRSNSNKSNKSRNQDKGWFGNLFGTNKKSASSSKSKSKSSSKSKSKSSRSKSAK